MSGPNKRTVQQRDDGSWEGRAPGAARASVVGATQGEVVDRTRELLAHSGGGELAIRGVNGQIRQQDTVKPANDPRASAG